MSEEQDVTGTAGEQDAKAEESSTSTNDTTVTDGQGGEAAKTDDTSDKEPAEEKVPAGVKKRIDELTRKRHDAEREAAYLRGQLEANKTVKAPEQAPAADRGPQPDQFTSYDDYIDARAEYKAEAKYKSLREAERKEEAEKATRTRDEQVEQTFRSKIEDFKSKTPDFDDVVARPELKISKVMYEALRETEVGPQIAYHLGKNPGEAERISQLTPIGAIREIGKLEAKFTQAPAIKTSTKINSDAPPPPAIVDGTSGGGKKDPSKMTDDEWFAWNKAERLKKFQVRK